MSDHSPLGGRRQAKKQDVDDGFTRAAELSAEFANELFQLLKVICCDPAAGVSAFTVSGGNASWFAEQPDLEIIWSTAASGLDRAAAKSAAYEALQAANLVDESAVVGNDAMRWSRRTLSEFFDGFNAGPTPLQTREIANRVAVARNLWADLNQLAFKPKTARQLIADHPEQAPYTINGFSRRAEVINLVGVPKSKKSWFAMMLAVCFACGRAFLDKFEVISGKVLLVDNELHIGSIGWRLPRVAAAIGLMSDHYADSLHVLPMRGTGKTIDEMEAMILSFRPGDYDLIIFDAIYRFYPENFDENSNADWTRLMNRMDRWASHTQATIVLIHHTSKNPQGNKSVTDMGAGAGAQSRAADGHWVIREHEDEDCAVLQAAVRSWAPLKPIGIRWSFPIWKLDETIDVTKLKKDTARGGRPRKGDASTTVNEPADAVWTPERFASDFVNDKPRPANVIIARATQKKLSEREARILLKLAEDDGLIYLHKMEKTRTIFYSNQPQKCTNKKHTRTPHTPQRLRA